MSSGVDNLKSEIKSETKNLVKVHSRKILIHAEVELNVISCGVYFMDQNDVVQFRFPSDLITDSISKFWNESRVSSSDFWNIIAISIEAEKFNVVCSYVDLDDKTEDSIMRETAALIEHFGRRRIDRSTPRGN